MASKILTIHPKFIKETVSNSTPAKTFDFINNLKSFQITRDYLNGKNEKKKTF